MKILFTGLPYFGKKLVAELKEFDKENSYYFFDTYYSKIDKVKFLFHLITAHKVVSVNGVSSKSGSLDWVVQLRKKIILQWQGSDVLTAKNNSKGRGLNRKYIDYGISFTDAPWLKDELSALNISADILHFKHVQHSNNLSPFTTNDAVSYLAEGKEKFYGIDHLIKLASDFPSIKFHIIGSKGEGFIVPENLIFYGWISKERVNQLLNEHPIFIRLTEHDGYSLSVMEAIANGNYVLWNQLHECVQYVADMKELVSGFAKLIELVNSSGNARNLRNIEWAKTNLNKEKILTEYITKITTI